MARRCFAAKAAVRAYWKSLDFLGFSRPNPDLSMGCVRLSVAGIFLGLPPIGAKRRDREPAIEAMRESGIAHTDSLAHLLCFRKQLSALANLYKALSPDSDPEFTTVARVLKALGLRLSVAA